MRDLTGANTPGRDFGAALLDSTVVYASPRAGRLKRRARADSDEAIKLWQAPLAGDHLAGEPTEFAAARLGRGGVGAVSIAADGSRLFVTRAADAGRRARRSRVAQRSRIFESQRAGDGWGPLQPVDLSGDGSASDAHAAVAVDGSWLVFASDRAGGFGGMDLWGVRREGEGWGTPYNLGRAINTDADEVYPFLAADETLYYSTQVSAGGADVGHLDLVYSRQRGQAWETPVALGAPFNSAGDDFGLVVDEANRRGLFSSRRAGGLGAEDLYAFEIFGDAVGPAVELVVEVTRDPTGQPLQGAAITYVNADRTALSEALARGIVSTAGDPMQVVGGETEMTDVAGRRTIKTVRGDYLLDVRREGYESVQLPVTLVSERMVLPIRLSPKPVCADVVLSVVDAQTLVPMAGARLRVEPQGEGAAPPTQELRSDGGGRIAYCLPCGDIYALTADLEGFAGRPAVYDGREASCGNGDRTVVTLYVSALEAERPAASRAVAGVPLSAGTSLQLPSVFYALNEYSLSPAAKRDLDGLVDLLGRYPETRIELGSHTDAIGESSFNQRLSQRRADEARRYLLEAGGIAPERVVAVGYGESALRNGCRDGVPCSAEAHRENRRTEVVILGADGLAAGGRAGSRATYGTPAARERAATAERRRATATPGESRGGEMVYLVVAGSYATDAEAERAASALLGLGYGDVRVEALEGVTGRAVVAGRFKQLSEAAQFSRALREAHGLTAYVRKVAP